MSKTEKLLRKLKEGRIDGNELISLLKKLGWAIANKEGSHFTYSNGNKKITVIAERVDLKRYQIKQVQELLLPEEKEDDDEEKG